MKKELPARLNPATPSTVLTETQLPPTHRHLPMAIDTTCLLTDDEARPSPTSSRRRRHSMSFPEDPPTDEDRDRARARKRRPHSMERDRISRAHLHSLAGDADDESKEWNGIEDDVKPERPTRPLPKKALPPRPSSNPNLRSANPALLPVQAVIPRTSIQRASTRRLIVVLENACLEAYRVGGSSGRPGSKGGGDAKYALLNCDDHQGILAKTGRDIADARPDITHQASGVAA